MKSDDFNYTYSAPKQDEIRRIKEKYTPKSVQADKMDQLRRLDKSVSEKATMIAMTVGIIGTLIMGGGMSLILVWADRLFIPGIIIGIVGIAILATAFPLYRRTYNIQRDKVAPLILKLTEELEQ